MLNIYTYTHIGIMLILCHWNNVMYTCVLELGLALAAYCKSIPVFIIILYFYMIFYDICILLCHIYKKNNIRTAQVEHLHNPYCIRIIKLTREHPSSRCRFSFELTKIFRIMQLFQWYYTI